MSLPGAGSMKLWGAGLFVYLLLVLFYYLGPGRDWKGVLPLPPGFDGGVGASVRVTHDVRLIGVGRITERANVPMRRVDGCKHCVTGISRDRVGRRGIRRDGLVLIATVAPAGTNVNGAAISVKLTLKLGGVKGGAVITLHRPSLNPYFKVGKKTTKKKCTRILPVSGVGLRFANSFRTVASTRGVVSTLLSGCLCRGHSGNFKLGRIL